MGAPAGRSLGSAASRPNTSLSSERGTCALTSLGGFGFGLSQLLFLYIVVKAITSGEKAPQRPWEGADTLEWTELPSPPPYHSFETPPVVR